MVDITVVDTITTMVTDTDLVTIITMGTDILMDVVTVHNLVSMDTIETKAIIIDTENRLVMGIVDTIKILEPITVTTRIHATIDITEIQNTIGPTITTERQDLLM